MISFTVRTSSRTYQKKSARGLHQRAVFQYRPKIAVNPISSIARLQASTGFCFLRAEFTDSTFHNLATRASAFETTRRRHRHFLPLPFQRAVGFSPKQTIPSATNKFRLLFALSPKPNLV